MRKSETLGTAAGSGETVLAVELVEDGVVNRDVAWRGLLELEGGRGGLDRRRGALVALDAIPACWCPKAVGKQSSRFQVYYVFIKGLVGCWLVISYFRCRVDC